MTEQSWPADKVERRSVESLIPYARNARTHDDAQVAQIAASIKEWGWTTPVLVDETGMLIAGHGRVMAARLLGLLEIPVMTASGWTENQKRAYVLADNKLALNAGWDESLLKIELDSLMDEGFDLSITGFSLDDLSSMTMDTSVPEDLEQLTQPNAEYSNPLKLSFGKKKVPLTEGESAWLHAQLEKHLNEYGMVSGFIEKTLNVRS